MDSAGFLLRYPEFKGVDPLVMDAFLQDSADELDKRRWGKLYERGVYALAAHTMSASNYASTGSSSQAGAPLQAVQSESAGQLSVSYAQAAPSDSISAYLSSTRYGQEFLRLQAKVGACGIMVIP